MQALQGSRKTLVRLRHFSTLFAWLSLLTCPSRIIVQSYSFSRKLYVPAREVCQIQPRLCSILVFSPRASIE